MPRHTGQLAWDADRRVEKLFHRQHDGDWVWQMRQDCDPILDANKEAQNHLNPNNADKSMRMVARIPVVIIEKWRNELGIDYFNKDHQEAVNRLLNSSEWAWLRTDNSVL